MSSEIQEYIGLWEDNGIEISENYKRAILLTRRSVPPPVPLQVSVPITQAAYQTLQEVRAWIGDCERCGLCQTRKNIVFGTGPTTAPLLFVGEGPGADEDEQGQPFVGKAGQLLNKILEAMGYQRDQVYIANIVKCRPPDNRVPEPVEAESCLPFLRAQIEILQPKLIVALGLTAATYLSGKSLPLSQMRGKFQPLQWNPKIEVLSTYHPAYLLRNPDAKKIVWNDMKQVLQRLKCLS